VNGIRIAPLGQDDGEEVAVLWRDAGMAGHPLGPAAWRAWWASPDADAGLAWGARETRGAREARGRLLGALLARAPVRPWAPDDIGHVALFAVAEGERGHGVGAALWDAATAAMRARGRRRLRIGADPERLLPGVPLTAPEATWRFLRARGIRPGGLEADLRLDLAHGAIDAHPLPDGVECVDDDDDPEATLAFVGRAFPGRWVDEVARAAAAGTAVLGLRREGITLGFCLAQRPTDAAPGPGLTWTALGPWGPLDPTTGGLGPLGIDAAARGGGLGLALVAASARWLRAHELRTAVIDWTTLTAFYGRLGATAWRVYQRAEGEL
jgi:GNAT superfamily N-acetyltransferase